MCQKLSLGAIVATLAFVSLIISSLATTEEKLVGENDIPKFNLKYLGAVDGKSYFVEENSTMTWTAARTHCNSSDLKLAAIDTKIQVEFLSSKLFADYGDAHFWISSYMWPPTEALGIASMQTFSRVISRPPLYCTFAYASNETTFGMYSWHCDFNRIRVLCES